MGIGSTRFLTTYDLVSHGTETSGQNECWGTYNSTSQTGYGPGYQYGCTHSGSNQYSGGDTVWYNYAIATAGTIIDENTTSSNLATNANTATESICPSGWTLPTTKQIDSNRDINNFNPVLGGRYHNGTLENMDKYGRWWGSEAWSNSASRQALGYTISSSGNPSLSSSAATRHRGDYIRCVSEEKTATDLTYMQDMTPQTSFWTLVNGRSYDEV